MSIFGIRDTFDAVDRRAAHQVHRLPKTKIGYVTSYNPDTYSVRVRIEPESTAAEARGEKPIESNWLPIFRPYGGNGWGLFTPPNANPSAPYGDMALVLFPDASNGVALIGFSTDKEIPFTSTRPDGAIGGESSSGGAPPKANEFILMHPTGAFIKIHNDGSVRINAKSNAKFEAYATGDAGIVAGSAGTTFVTIDAAGNIQLGGAGGAGFFITNGTPVGPPGSNGVGSAAVVTKGDLQDAVDWLIVEINKRINGVANPTSGPYVVKASTTITATD